jgi:succinate dehydrogenase / fumarate reductase, flavoprotein subunit
VDGMGSESFQQAMQLRFTLAAAEAILRAALLRTESRGAHFRSDAPELREEWARNVTVEREPGGALRLGTKEVPPVSPALEQVLRDAPEPEYHHQE